MILGSSAGVGPRTGLGRSPISLCWWGRRSPLRTTITGDADGGVVHALWSCQTVSAAGPWPI
jgi:hypothetical protein